MPTSQSPKRKKTQHKKCQRIDDEDGWTHVVRGPRLPSTELNRPGVSDKASKLRDALIKGEHLTLEETRKRYHKAQEAWSEDPRNSTFEELFVSRIESDSDIHVDSAMLLGLGSPSGDIMNTAALSQLVVFDHWVTYLRTKFTIRQVYVQDPKFVDVDENFLAELGYTVIKDPEAYILLTPKTFLFAPYVPYLVTYTFFYAAYPAIFIGNRVDLEMSFMKTAEEQDLLHQQVVKEFYSSRSTEWLGRLKKCCHDCKPSPGIEWLSNIWVYWPISDQVEGMQGSVKTRELLQEDNKELLKQAEKNGKRIGHGIWIDAKGFVFDDDLYIKIQEARKARRSLQEYHSYAYDLSNLQ